MTASALLETVAAEFSSAHPGPAARAFERLSLDEKVEALTMVSPMGAAAVLAFADPRGAAAALAALDTARSVDVLAALDPPRAAQILAWIDETPRAQLMAGCAPQHAKAIERTLTYPPGTAGRLMYSRVITLRANMRVREAFERLRGASIRSITDLVVSDDEGRFFGLVPLLAAALADPEARLRSLVRRDVITVHPMTTRDEVVELLAGHKLSSLVVVDFEGRVVGILRHDSLVRAAEVEAGAATQTMVGVSKEERALAPPWEAVKSRLPWLNVNLLTAFLAAAVVGLFDRTIERFTVLAMLLPIVAGQSGNTGAQALAVTMRGLALREVRSDHVGRLMRKELVVGTINGVMIALVTSAGVYAWTRNSGVALVMGISMVLAMAVSGCAGVGVPMVLTALGRDPAVASSILLTTVTDVSGFFVFLGLATVLSSLL